MFSPPSEPLTEGTYAQPTGFGGRAASLSTARTICEAAGGLAWEAGLQMWRDETGRLRRTSGEAIRMAVCPAGTPYWRVPAR